MGGKRKHEENIQRKRDDELAMKKLNEELAKKKRLRQQERLTRQHAKNVNRNLRRGSEPATGPAPVKVPRRPAGPNSRGPAKPIQSVRAQSPTGRKTQNRNIKRD